MRRLLRARIRMRSPSLATQWTNPRMPASSSRRQRARSPVNTLKVHDRNATLDLLHHEDTEDQVDAEEQVEEGEDDERQPAWLTRARHGAGGHAPRSSGACGATHQAQQTRPPQPHHTLGHDRQRNQPQQLSSSFCAMARRRRRRREANKAKA